MHTFIAEVIAIHFNATAEAMLRHNQSDYIGLFKVDGKHFTCVTKGYPVPSNGFTCVGEVMHRGEMFDVYRAHPKAYYRFRSTR